jgi:hypothetical protein
VPDIDISDILLDSAIAGEQFTIIRRMETVNNYGERTSASHHILAIGSITPTGENSLVREDGYQTQTKTIKVITGFLLRGPSNSQLGKSFDPDIIQWRGDSYVVKTLNDYSQYGGGMIEADCGGIDYIDQADHNP